MRPRRYLPSSVREGAGGDGAEGDDGRVEHFAPRRAPLVARKAAAPRDGPVPRETPVDSEERMVSRDYRVA